MRERLREDEVLLRRPDRDADPGRSAEAGRRAHDHALPQEFLVDAVGVLADVGEDEVGDGRAGDVEPVLPEGAVDGRPSFDRARCSVRSPATLSEI